MMDIVIHIYLSSDNYIYNITSTRTSPDNEITFSSSQVNEAFSTYLKDELNGNMNGIEGVGSLGNNNVDLNDFLNFDSGDKGAWNVLLGEGVYREADGFTGDMT
jgi:hypothetical protein